MEPTVITWNFTNWVTIVIMALIGFLIYGLVVRGVLKIKQKQSGS